LGCPQGIVAGEGLQRPIERCGCLRDVARTHPYQLRETRLRIDEARLELEAIAQSRLGTLERALCDEAAGVGVAERRAPVPARERPVRDLNGFGWLAGRVQRDRQRVCRGGIIR